jgi:hypothetical protein
MPDFIRCVDFSLEFEDVALRESSGQHFCQYLHLFYVNVTTKFMMLLPQTLYITLADQ